MKAFIFTAASALAVVMRLSFANAQSAPENKPSIDMQRRGENNSGSSMKATQGTADTPSSNTPAERASGMGTGGGGMGAGGGSGAGMGDSGGMGARSGAGGGGAAGGGGK